MTVQKSDMVVDVVAKRCCCYTLCGTRHSPFPVGGLTP